MVCLKKLYTNKFFKHVNITVVVYNLFRKLFNFKNLFLRILQVHRNNNIKAAEAPKLVQLTI